jgi:hypothetical protein
LFYEKFGGNAKNFPAISGGNLGFLKKVKKFKVFLKKVFDNEKPPVYKTDLCSALGSEKSGKNNGLYPF